MRATADTHLAVVLDEAPQTSEACRVCLGCGSPWAHLRPCLTCGCRDSSLLRSVHMAGQPIVRSFEPGESRGWCHADEPYV